MPVIRSREALCLVTLLTASLGCARAPTPTTTGPDGEPATPSTTTTRQETPLTVTWVVAERTETSVRLTARVNQRAALQVPVKVAVVAPKGATLSGGAAAFSISPSDGPSVTDTVYVVSFAAVPTEDIVLTADASGAGFGVHATDVYRFGRPEPKVEVPAATGPGLKLGNLDLGRSVPIPETAASQK